MKTLRRLRFSACELSAMNIDDLVKAIQLGNVQVTDHADEEAQDDDLEYETIFSRSMVEKLLRNIQQKSLIPVALSLENHLKGNLFIVFGLTIEGKRSQY
jgi:hypothetical protein